ncbi:MAG: serine/threonine protein kinase [Polyangiaceae bacterium]|nr:serine/threonine protein kinase [Polyangiaceae bacterium]
MTATAVRDDLPKLEKYELIEEIGHGGMATVYRARDLRLDREVAVKIIHRHLRDNREVATRFIAEGRAAAKLKHRGIVEVYDVSNEEERERYLVVELVRGPTLRQLLLDHRDLPPEIGACIVIELCHALEHAHASGVIHRDIKPENVLVSVPDAAGSSAAIASSDDPKRSGPALSSPEPTSSKPPKSGRPDDVILKITDFGIAKILDAQGVTSTGQVLGSPAHMAPEQIDGGDVDPRTDVFALGVILYECLVGHLPFDGKNPAQVLRKVLEGRYERAETERPTVGGRFSEIVDRALALDPNDRPETPAALAGLLAEELDALGLAERSKELTAYFKGPEAYVEKLKTRLVPVLVTRGEAARRAKKVAAAARDFNRAHALAPDDIHILKRMTQLSGSSRSSRVPRNVALVALAAIGLGGAAYGGVRWLRAPQAKLGDTEVPTVRATSDVTVTRPPIIAATPTVKSSGTRASASASASARASADSEAGEPRHPTPPSTSSAAAGGGERLVKFQISPRTASLTIDGQTVTPGVAVPLKVGAHQAMITPQAGDTSCEPWTAPHSVSVGGRGENEPEELTLKIGLSWRPAEVKLQGAPAGGVAQCGTVTLTPGATVKVPMNAPSWEPSCKFMHEGTFTEGTVRFLAGKSRDVPWGGG